MIFLICKLKLLRYLLLRYYFKTPGKNLYFQFDRTRSFLSIANLCLQCALMHFFLIFYVIFNNIDITENSSPSLQISNLLLSTLQVENIFKINLTRTSLSRLVAVGTYITLKIRIIHHATHSNCKKG